MTNLPEEFRKIGIAPKGKPPRDHAGTVLTILVVAGVLVILFNLLRGG